MSRDVVLYEQDGDFLRAPGWEPQYIGKFTLGDTEPVVENSGVAGRPLQTPQQAGLPTASNGDVLITDQYHSDNATSGVLELGGLDIQGFVRVLTGKDVHADPDKGLRVRGGRPITGTTRTALIDCYSPKVGELGRENVHIYSADLIPSHPSEGIDAIAGHDFTIERSLSQHCVDGITIVNAQRPGDPARVRAAGNLVRDLYYTSPCSYQSDLKDGVRVGRTHNDDVQVQVGIGGWVLIGNALWANPSEEYGNGFDPQDPTAPLPNPYGPFSVTGQCIGLTPALREITDGTIHKNWLYRGRGGLVATNSKYPVLRVAVTENRFDRLQALVKHHVNGVVARRPIILQPGVDVPGMPATTGLDLQLGNVHLDGQPVTVYREDA